MAKKPPKGWGKSRNIAAKTARSLGAKPYKGGMHEDHTWYKGKPVLTTKLPENVRRAVQTARFGFDFTSQAKWSRLRSSTPQGTKLQNNQLTKEELRRAQGHGPTYYWTLYQAKKKG